MRKVRWNPVCGSKDSSPGFQRTLFGGNCHEARNDYSPRRNQRKTKGQQLKGKISRHFLNTFPKHFHTFSEFSEFSLQDFLSLYNYGVLLLF